MAERHIAELEKVQAQLQDELKEERSVGRRETMRLQARLTQSHMEMRANIEASRKAAAQKEQEAEEERARAAAAAEKVKREADAKLQEQSRAAEDARRKAVKESGEGCADKGPTEASAASRRSSRNRWH